MEKKEKKAEAASKTVRRKKGTAAKKAAAEPEVTYGDVINELALIAFSDISDVYDEDGKLLEPHLLEKKTAKTIRAIKAGRDGVTEIRKEDKLRALAMLAKLLSTAGKDDDGGQGLKELDEETLKKMIDECRNG